MAEIFEFVLLSFHMQRVFIQYWLNSFWITYRLHLRLNSNWTSRVGFCIPETSVNVNKLFIVYCVYVCASRIVVAIYPLFFYTALCYCLFIFLDPYFFFILTLLLYFCLLVNHVNKPIIFVFEAFVDYFNNTNSIFATIFIKNYNCSVMML